MEEPNPKRLRRVGGAESNALLWHHGYWFPQSVPTTRLSMFNKAEDPPLLLKEQQYLGRLSAILSIPKWWEIAFEHHSRAQPEDPVATAFLMDELRHIYDLRAVQLPETLFWAGTATGLFLSDNAIPVALHDALVAALIPVETQALEDQRWRRGYEDCVLDTLHPLHEVLVFGTSHFSLRRNVVCGEYVAQAPVHVSAPKPGTSLYHQCLPSEFTVSESGQVAITSRIVGLDDRSSSLYPTLTKMFEHFLPLFEQTLAEMNVPTPMRLTGFVDFTPDVWMCRDDWNLHAQQRKEARRAFLRSCNVKNVQLDSNYERELRYAYCRERIDAGEVTIPDRDAFPPFETFLRRHDGFQLTTPTLLHARNLLVYTKIQSICLTPDTPEMNDLPWQFDGSINEAIVATCVYCYALDNIASSARIEFRAEYDTCRFVFNRGELPLLYEQYGIEPDVTCNLHSTGHVTIAQGRTTVFPNYMQHRFSQLRLKQPDVPGYCKLLIFSLVQPDKKILSTVEIPPQRGQSVITQLQKIVPVELPDTVLWTIVEFAASVQTDESLRTAEDNAWRERTKPQFCEGIPYYCSPVYLEEDDIHDE